MPPRAIGRGTGSLWNAVLSYNAETFDFKDLELLVMAILLSNDIAQCDDHAAVGWAWTGRNLILDEAVAVDTVPKA